MSRAKSHHYVPQGYLKRFANNKGYVRIYDRLSETCRKQHIREVAAENNLYTILGPDNLPSDAFEQGPLALIDGAILPIRDRLLDHRPVVSPGDRQVVELFLAVQVMRTPSARSMMHDLYDQSLRMNVEMNVGDESPERVEHFIVERYPQASEFEKERIRGIAANPSTPIDLTTEQWIDIIRVVAPRLTKEFETRAWTLVDAPPRKWFLTGDLPVALAGPHPIGLREAPYIFWPLSPKRILQLGPQGSSNGTLSLGSMNPARVDSVNQLIADRAERQIYWYPDHHPDATIRLPKGPLMSSINGIPVGPGEFSYDKIRQDWIAFRDHQRANRDTASTVL